MNLAISVYFTLLYLSLQLITIHISDSSQFSDIRISQGSVATYLRVWWDI